MNYKISMDSIITIPGYMAWRMYGDFGILIKIAKGQHPCHVLFELNDIACWIWDIIAKTGSLRFSELLNRVNSEFSLKRQGAINDIESFLRDAVSKGILRVSGTQNFHLERKSLHAGSEKNLWSNKIWERYFNNSIDKCIPITETIDLTNKCNQRCVHCYNKNHSFEKVSLSDFYSVLDQLQELGTLKILFTGC